MEKERLQKYMAGCGVASRRKCEEMISEGRVTVNGITAQIGDSVDPGVDKVVLDGGARISKSKEEKIYLVLNKPKGYITAASDDRGRQTVMELVKDVGKRVYPVGRLDFNSEGVIFLTNDGDFSYALTHPKHQIEKGYEVTVSGTITQSQVDKLSKPFDLDGYKTRGANVSIILAQENKTVLYVGITEGRNRQVRKMCESMGLLVRRLRRVCVGNVKLGDLQLGKYRHLTKPEVAELLGEKQI